MRTQILATISLGVLLAGCQVNDRPKGQAMAAQPAELICDIFMTTRGNASYDKCVDFQKAHDPGQSVPPFRMDQYNNRVDAQGYEVDGMGRRMPVQSPYRSLAGQAMSGQVILVDEYGNRYDALGNRVK
jgi:hypothetical protein